MQKVVAKCLKVWPPRTEHGVTEELFGDYLADGWRVVNTVTSGGASDACGVVVWVIVTLEKLDPR